MYMPFAIRSMLHRFSRDERGSISIEAMLVFPMLTWCYLAGFVWFDAFRAESLNEKATYAIGDALSRQTEMVDPNFVASLLNLHRVMTFSEKPTRVRVSQIEWSTADQTHTVNWSTRVGYAGANDLSDGDIAPGTPLAEKIPIMSDGEKLIVVETWLPYEPIFNIGLGGFVFDTFTVIRPRYAPQVCFDRNSTGDPIEAEC